MSPNSRLTAASIACARDGRAPLARARQRTRPLGAPRLQRGALCVLLAFSTFAGTALAQSESDRIRELERKLEQSIRLIDDLSDKVKRLEAGAAGAPRAATAGTGSGTAAGLPGVAAGQVAEQQARIDSLEQSVNKLSTTLSASGNNSAFGIPVHGFADVGAGISRGIQGAPGKGFNVGTMSLYLTPQFTDRVRGLLELAFEFDRNGALATDLERAQLGYAFGDAATLWMGRVHTPFGYWNNAFHHGQQIATSLRRPQFIDFEDKGGIIPVHMVGAWVTGSKAALGGKLTYDLFAGNSPRLALDANQTPGSGTLNMNNSGSTNHYLMQGFNTSYIWASGLRVGLHGLRANLRDDALAPSTVAMRMLGGYAVYDENDWEVIAEYYRFRNTNLISNTGAPLGSFTSSAGFVQVGKNIGRWTPYARAERAMLDQNDLYFAQQASGRPYARGAIGLRYDLDPKAAIKFELSGTRQYTAGIPNSADLRLQYSIRF